MNRVCLIEDDEIMGGALSLRFELEGIDCDWHRTGKTALAALRRQSYCAVVSDIRLPDISGETLYLELLDSGTATPPFIFMTGQGAVDQAVRLLKRGAVEDLLPRLAASRASVLITGESGVGKERVALKLHNFRGLTRPFIAANCGAFTENLLEAELFGHEKGAFTGALRVRRGLFEQAEGGTLLLDEIGDMPLPMQVKVLRAIQERRITRVGGENPIAVDFCLIAATHQDLRTRVEQGLFREDLYYRINVIQIRVPPLRERREDILWLAARFLDQAAQTGDGRHLMLSPTAERALLEHTWPGNVRELKHLLERASVLTSGPLLTPELLFGDTDRGYSPQPRDTLGDYLTGHERDYILRALESQSWQIQETANLLGISRKNLWEKMKRLEISRPDRF